MTLPAIALVGLAAAAVMLARNRRADDRRAGMRHAAVATMAAAERWTHRPQATAADADIVELASRLPLPGHGPRLQNVLRAQVDGHGVRIFERTARRSGRVLPPLAALLPTVRHTVWALPIESRPTADPPAADDDETADDDPGAATAFDEQFAVRVAGTEGSAGVVEPAVRRLTLDHGLSWRLDGPSRTLATWTEGTVDDTTELLARTEILRSLAGHLGLRPAAMPADVEPASRSTPPPDPGAVAVIPPASVPVPPAPPPIRSGRTRSGLGAAVAVVAIVAALAVGMDAARDDDGASFAGGEPPTEPLPTTAPDPTTTTTTTVATTAPSSPAPPDASGPLVEAGGLAYPALGAPWQSAVGERYSFVEEMDGEAGQAVEVETLSGDPYSAFVLIGSFSGGYEVATRGSPDLAVPCETIAEQIAGEYYAAATGVVETVSSEPVTVGERPAHRVELEVAISHPELETRSETVIVEVVDIAPGQAGLVYASLPDVRPELRADVDRALAALHLAT